MGTLISTGVPVACCRFCTCCLSKAAALTLYDESRAQGAAGGPWFWDLVKSWAGGEGSAAAQVFTKLIVLCFPLSNARPLTALWAASCSLSAP
jgi:hypothetical protein